MLSAEVLKDHAQRVMACVSLLLCASMLVEVIRKIRCGAKIRIKRKQYGHQSMTLTQELTIYAFYGLATLWNLSYILCFSIFPISRFFGSSADIHSLCHPPVAVLSVSTVLYQIALVNILTDRCNQCVLCLVQCLWNRPRLDEVAAIELNLQRAAELAMQSVPRGPDERPAAGNEDSGRPQSDHEIEEIEDKGAMGGGLEMEEDDSIVVALSPSKYIPNDLELDVAPKTATKKILDEADRRKNNDAVSESQCTKQLTCGLDVDRTSGRMERVGLPPLDQPAKDKVPRSDCKEENIPAVNVKLNPLGLEMVMSQSSEWNGSTHSSPRPTKELKDAALSLNQTQFTKDVICEVPFE